MNALKQPRHHYRFSEYLTLCEDSNVRLEFWNGQIYAMSGGTVEHSRLSARVVSLLEGGYNLEALAASTAVHLRELLK